jgi:exopolysaccharide production protein ExoQ
MPPLLALLLCTALVLFLLGLEKRVSRGATAAVWIPTIWMLTTASRPLGAWFGAMGGNESGSTMDRFFLSGLGFVGIMVLVRRHFNWRSTAHRQIWLLVLLAYMCLSTLWSDITLIALKRWGREWVVIVMALVIISEPNTRQAFAALLRRSAYVLIPFSLVLIKYYPMLGRQYGRWSGIEMWVGVAEQKNQLGRLCMITIFFLLFALYERWCQRSKLIWSYLAWCDLFIIVMAVFLLKGSDSATSLATLGVGITIFLGMQWLRKMTVRVPQSALLALVISLAAYGISVPFLAGANVAQFTSMLGRDNTLTGRTEVWADVLPARNEKPLLGYGFGSFWTDERRELYDIPTAHNGYLDILLELGEVGLAFYMAWLLSCARRLHRALKGDYQWASFAICLLLMSLIYNATESALNSLTEYVTAVVVFASFVVPALHARSRSALPVQMRLKTPALGLESSAEMRSWQT